MSIDSVSGSTRPSTGLSTGPSTGPSNCSSTVFQPAHLPTHLPVQLLGLVLVLGLLAYLPVSTLGGYTTIDAREQCSLSTKAGCRHFFLLVDKTVDEESSLPGLRRRKVDRALPPASVGIPESAHGGGTNGEDAGVVPSTPEFDNVPCPSSFVLRTPTKLRLASSALP